MALSEQEDPIVREAYVMSHDYIAYVTGRASSRAPSKTAAALRNAGDELLEKFPIFFKRWPRLFQDVSEENACMYLIKILDEHFKPQKPNPSKQLTWSEILSIYVLAGQMAIHCQENGMEKILDSLPDQVGEYVEKLVCPVLKEKGGWASLKWKEGFHPGSMCYLHLQHA
ncbi:bcl-2-related ovarian killer protein homolog A-like isoform X2 [Protopterus annectens]|uniref:bcl-2-related ovarian killer protein homolog A-like isoform X2 n=1 Tax=Protopterus annectens TaxID=7888 RepID=UPI001CF9D67B|nr:bcl-2-related ovarian killer protein homolog A-like isoform X2 [Protopterus annectens]